MLQNVRKRKTRAKHIYKTALSVKAKTLPTTQLCLWFLLLCTVVVLTLTPIFGARKPQVNAGSTSGGLQFTNAPWITVNNGEALFIGGHYKYPDVLTVFDLLQWINDARVWDGYKKETPTQNSSITTDTYYLSAKNFGKLNDGSASANGGTANSNAAGNAQLHVKLVDSTTSNAVTSTWQVVYRSMDANNDILTIYMDFPYMLTSSGYFNFTSQGAEEASDTIFCEMMSLYDGYINLGDIFVSEIGDVPGNWQSDAYQTGSGKTAGTSAAFNGSSVNVKNNCGPNWTSQMWLPSSYELVYRDSITDGDVSYPTTLSSASSGLANAASGGSDGVNDGRSGLWELNGYDRASKSVGSGNDDIWLRSGNSDGTQGYHYSSVANGFGLEDGASEYGLRAAIHLNLKYIVANCALEIIPSVNAPADMADIGWSITPDSSSGLQTVLPAYNYAKYIPNIEDIDSETDVSGIKRVITFDAIDTTNYKVDSVSLDGSEVKITSSSGNGTDYSYTYNNGMLKLTIWNCAGLSEYSVTLNVASLNPVLNLKVTNSAPNSLLLLTLMNGTTKLGEYGFVYSGGEQTVSVTLPKNTTIKILATKPFGSRVRFVLDGTDLAPTGVTSYQVASGAGVVKNLAVTLTGDGSWSNSIVI